MRISGPIHVDRGRLSSGLSAALSLCGKVQESGDDRDVLDFSCIPFVTPTLVLPLFVYLNGVRKSVEFENVTEYMRRIGFGSPGTCVDTGAKRATEFAAILELYSGGNYIPLIAFPSSPQRVNDRDSVIGSVEAMIRRQSGLDDNVMEGLTYMLSETVDNICEHSMSASGYIIAQSYPTMKYIDVCIGDTGMTLLGSYRSHGMDVAETDRDAIRAANKGVSTKNLPKAENRGFGISTTKRMLVAGMGGQYMMLSGSAVYIGTPEREGYLDLPHDIHINGTIIAFRIPFNKRDFRYIEYVE